MVSPFSRLGVCNLATSLISGTGKATDFKFFRVHLQVQSEQKSIKNFGENGAWAYPETAQIFWVPAIILGTNKAIRTSNFVATFTNSP